MALHNCRKFHTFCFNFIKRGRWLKNVISINVRIVFRHHPLPTSSSRPVSKLAAGSGVLCGGLLMATPRVVVNFPGMLLASKDERWRERGWQSCSLITYLTFWFWWQPAVRRRESVDRKLARWGFPVEVRYQQCVNRKLNCDGNSFMADLIGEWWCWWRVAIK